MNDFNKVDKIGQEKVIKILNNIFNCQLQILPHYDNSRTDIDMTAYTHNSAVTYTIECKDRWGKYDNEYLIKNGAMIEIDKFYALQEKRIENQHNKAIYANTTVDGWVIYDLTTVKDIDLILANPKRSQTTVNNNGKMKTKPCFYIPEKYIVCQGKYVN